MVTKARLKEVLSYISSTGEFIWNKSNNGRVGKIAGCLRQDGYTVIEIDHKLYRAHRLVWLYVNGYFPTKTVDHINGNRSDNRIENLRDVSIRENLNNLGSHRDGRLPGAIKDASSSKNPWRASIRIRDKRKHIGMFPTEKEAHKAYISKAKELLAIGEK